MRARKPRSQSVKEVRQKISSARRDIKSMLRTLDTLDMGQKELKKVVPPKFQNVPFEGGAESYLKDIEGMTPKQMSMAFGTAVGMKQLWAKNYRTMLKEVTEDKASYAEMASAVLMVIIYQFMTSSDAFTGILPANVKAGAKAISKAYIAEFKSSQDITKCIDEVAKVDISIGTGTTATTEKVGNKIPIPDLIYPFNGSYIRYLTSLLQEEVIIGTQKADFVFKNRSDLYALVASGSYPDNVPTPNEIASITSATNLKDWFDRHPEYSLSATFALLSRSVDTSALAVMEPNEFNAIQRAVRLALDDMESGIIKAGLGTSENLADMSAFRSRILENMVARPSEDNIKDLMATLEASKSCEPDTSSVDALSAHTFKDVAICEVIENVSTGTLTNYSPKDKPEFLQFQDAFIRLLSLVKDYESAVISPSARADFEAWLNATFTGDELLEKGASAGFKDLANSTLTTALGLIENIGFKGSDIPAPLRDNVLKALNGLLEGYTDVAPFKKDGAKLVPVSGVVFKDVVIEDILNGGSIDIFDSSTNDLSESLYETQEALEDISDSGVDRATEDMVYGKILKSANILQSTIDSILPSALRDPQLKLRGNPALSTMHKVGIGVASYVGTNIGTSLMHRYLPASVNCHVAEYALPAVVGGVGGYLAYKGNKDVGIPLLVGAGSSAVMRLITKKVDHNGAFYKYFLKYAGGAYTAEKIGDNYFADLPAYSATTAPAIETAPATETETETAENSTTSTSGFGRYLSTPVHDPYYVYQPPKRIPASQRIDKYEDIAQTGKVYAGTAGTDGMGRYVPTAVDKNDPEIEEMMEHLGNAIPLTSSELQSEGLGRYVSDTVVRATHTSAVKLQDAGVAEVLKPSDKDPNTSLIRVADLGQPVVEEPNPSLPHNSYGPTQINYAGNQDVVPSGLFNRGAFYSSLPKK